MAALAYTGGKREINYYFSVRSAKALALGAVLLLTACHAASRRYRGEGAAAGAPRGAAAAGPGRRSPGGAREPRPCGEGCGSLRPGQPRRAGAVRAPWGAGAPAAAGRDPGGQRRRGPGPRRPAGPAWGSPQAPAVGRGPAERAGLAGLRRCGVCTESAPRLRGHGLRQVKLRGYRVASSLSLVPVRRN